MKKEIIRRKTNTICKLEDALLSLLEGKELMEISTRELCSLAKVNHQTFYNYYYDCLDLYSDLEKKAITEILSVLHSGFRFKDQSEYIYRIKETKYFTRLIRQKNNSIFKETLKEKVFPQMEDEIRIMSREKERKYLTTYIFNGSLAIIEEWIRNDYGEDPEYIASLVYRIAASIDIYH